MKECSFRPQTISKQYYNPAKSMIHIQSLDNLKKSIHIENQSNDNKQKVTDYKDSNHKRSPWDNCKDRCMHLFELSKKSVKKHDKKTDEYIYEKNPQQYTFKPSIKTSKKYIPKQNLKRRHQRVNSATVALSKPLMNVDVIINDEKERITVMSKDDIKKLAKEFSIKHSIFSFLINRSTKR